VPIFVGNILETNDIFEILNSEIARKIRFQILNKTYHYCNSTICSYFQKIDKNRYETFPTNKEDLVKKDFVDSPELYLANIPKEIIFDFDYTCNLKCPSCRTENINWNNDYVIRPTNNKIVKKIKELIIDKIDNSLTTIRWCGGEPFMSEVYLDLLDYISNSNKTNIQNVIQTNGSLFQAKEKLVLKLLPYISTLRISYDAGCEETYKLTRVGGDWKRLLENTNFVLTLIKDNNFRTSVQADFVVQKNNYKDIPEFISICKNFNITPNLQKMWNWGTWDDEIFEEQNIYNVNHSLYNNLKQIFEIVNIPIAKN
jgi:MoaA/NifB/PqqE/SkfB family radical SAM enzyme